MNFHIFLVHLRMSAIRLNGSEKDPQPIEGKKMGRGIKHFLEEGAKIANEKGENPYRKLAIEQMLNKKDLQKNQE